MPLICLGCFFKRRKVLRLQMFFSKTLDDSKSKGRKPSNICVYKGSDFYHKLMNETTIYKYVQHATAENLLLVTDSIKF